MVRKIKARIIKNAEIFDDRYFDETLEGLKWGEYLKDTNRKDFCGNKTRRECNNLVLMFILRTFWRLVIGDIIYNNVRFTFIKKRVKHVSLSIVNRDRSNKNYRYRVQDRGNHFMFYVETSNYIKKKTKKIHILTYGEKLKDMFQDEIKKGHEYELLKPFR